MTVTGISFERAYHTRLGDLRRQAYLAARARQAGHRPLANLASALRALAARLEGSGAAATGPWQEDFTPATTWRA